MSEEVIYLWNGGRKTGKRARRRRRRGNPTGVTFSGAYYRPLRRRGSRPRYTRVWKGRSRAVFARHVPRGWGAVAKRLASGRVSNVRRRRRRRSGK